MALLFTVVELLLLDEHSLLFQLPLGTLQWTEEQARCGQGTPSQPWRDGLMGVRP